MVTSEFQIDRETSPQCYSSPPLSACESISLSCNLRFQVHHTSAWVQELEVCGSHHKLCIVELVVFECHFNGTTVASDHPFNCFCLSCLNISRYKMLCDIMKAIIISIAAYAQLEYVIVLIFIAFTLTV